MGWSKLERSDTSGGDGEGRNSTERNYDKVGDGRANTMEIGLIR